MEQAAGFWRRVAAALVDGIFLTVLIVLFAFAVFGEFAAEERLLQAFEGGLTLVYFLLVPVLWYGYTLGKKALGVRIVKQDGSRVTIGTTLLRYVVSGLVYSLTAGIALIVSAFMIGLRKDKRAIHDFIAGTYVKMEK
ncbi:RDD family protein [Alkalicoccus chagannorensis]|uniref:RDD family protein n=1 Tax=Alkalicoccus chagannorensis TaxID=427072 RepID=UPI00042679F2|nr:RDD family protein [Alkalicoccus chagannorensis]